MNFFIKSFVLISLGLFVVLGISLYKGTVEFNNYCKIVQNGNHEGIYFSGKGDELGGFTGCVLNTPTIDIWILFLGTGVVAFLGQIYLVNSGKRKITFNLAFTGLFTVVFSIAVTASLLVFPRVSHGFLEGGTSLLQAESLVTLGSLFSSFPVLILAYFLYCQSGPAVLSAILKSPSRTKFVLWSILLQILISTLIILCFIGGNMIHQKIYPSPKILLHPNDKTTIINGTLNLPSPGVKPGTYYLDSSSDRPYNVSLPL